MLQLSIHIVKLHYLIHARVGLLVLIVLIVLIFQLVLIRASLRYKRNPVALPTGHRP